MKTVGVFFEPSFHFANQIKGIEIDEKERKDEKKEK